MPKIRIHIKTIVEMIGSIQPPPVIILPIFCCLPRFVVGMPVALAIFCFAFVTPNALLQLYPGIIDFLLFAILSLYFQ